MSEKEYDKPSTERVKEHLEEGKKTFWVAIIVLHHSRKAETDDIVDVASGTLGLTGAADHLIVLRNDKLEITGRDLPSKSVDLAFDRGKWEVLGDSAHKSKPLDKVGRIERDAKIRKLHGDGLSVREIAKQTGYPRSTVQLGVRLPTVVL
jgi:hypothetical protein